MMNTFDELTKEGYCLQKDEYHRYVLNINSFSSYKNLLDTISFCNYYYRGQSDDSWPLLSSLYRHWNEYKNSKSFIDYEFLIIKNYIESKYCLKKDKKNILDVMSELQHYGGKTRFIDFTRDPYVASYFALKGIKKRDSLYTAAVYMIRKELFDQRKIPSLLLENNVTLEKWNKICIKLADSIKENKGRLYHYDPKLLSNKRVERQKGLFVFSGNPYHSIDMLIDIRANIKLAFSEIDRKIDREKSNRIKCILQLSSDSLFEFKNELNKIGINNEYLFPGKDGFCSGLNEAVLYSH